MPEQNRARPEIASIRALVGVSGWKRRALARFFGDRLKYFSDPARAVQWALAEGGAVGVWATREPPDLADLARAADVPVGRIEDGFIRSVGLGASFIPGASIVVDFSGIYFDPSRPSDLETLLLTRQFSGDDRRRAGALMSEITRHGLTKYNLEALSPVRLPEQRQRRILVPGQVEDDRSVILGGAGIRTNLALLEAVRRDNPDGFIVYKPHPDVEAGHRAGQVPPEKALEFADMLAPRTSIASLFDQVDEVHTLTSLAGFEGLLRGIPVTVYGQPFYASWGLTNDKAPISRRTRRLTLDELVAGVLIFYPLYVDPVAGTVCEPETLLQRLANRSFWSGAGALGVLRALQGRLINGLRGVGLDLRKP